MTNLLQVLGLASLVCLTQASSYADLMADLQMLYNAEQQKDQVIPEYYSENPYADKMNDWGMLYPDMNVVDEPAPKQARDYGEAVLRDQEYMKQLPLSGYHFISGGSGRDEEPSEVKTDKVLPAYCNPPNPCPVGYTEDDDCITNFENSPENNQRLQEQETCACDTEHMLTCPEGQNTIDPKSADFGAEDNNSDMGNLDNLADMDLGSNGQNMEALLTLEQLNMAQQPKRVAAKKAAPQKLNTNM